MSTVGATAALARFVAGSAYGDLPEAVIRESRRCVLDHLGLLIGAAGHPAAEIALAEAREEGGEPQATVIGYGERLPVTSVALVLGILSHVLDYDDTHAVTILHGTGPSLAAALPLAEQRRMSGRDLIAAHAVGFEAGARVSRAVWPDHYDVGWHMTGTAGTICAAAAACRMLGLGAERVVHALGLAATQAAGHRVHFGSMAKSFHVGKAAMNGVLAARLAARGFTAAPDGLEGRRGLFGVMSARADPSAISEDLGSRWEIFQSGFKPYSCGLVTHPSIDLARQAIEAGVRPDEVEAVELRVHPLVPELCGKTDVDTGLEAKFSVTACVALMLVDGRAGPRQFTDASVRRPAVRELARRVRASADARIGLGEARGLIRLRDGRRLSEHVPAARGTPARPMTDAELREKFTELAAPRIGREAADHVAALVERLEELDDVSELAAAAVPRASAAAAFA